MATIDRNGVQIYYETRGTGPAILLTHGFSATSAMWSPQHDALSESHTLITWDMRGHGQSAAPADDALYSEALTVADLSAILDELGFATAIIGGLSLGGYMSLAFQATHPERVRGLLILDCGPGYRKAAPREAWNETARQRASEIEHSGLAALGPASAEQATAEHNNVQGLAYAARNMLTQHSSRVIDSLPEISAPALVVAGANDTPFLGASDYMAVKIPGATKLIIADAGHAVNMDQPAVFNSGVLAFLAQHGL